MENELIRFEDFPIPEIVIKATKALNYEFPSNIQKQLLNSFSSLNNNILITSKAGSGKTFTYLIGVLACLNLDKNNLQAVILLPTRELASQTSFYLEKINDSKLLSSEITFTLLIGGKKDTKLENKHMIAIGTLGRMKKLFKNNINKFRNFVDLKVLVIDEADKLLNQNQNNNYENFLKILINPSNLNLKSILVTASFDETSKLFYQRFLKNIFIIKSKDNQDNNNLEDNTIVSFNPSTINSHSASNIKEYYLIFHSKNKSTYYEEKYSKLFEIIQTLKDKFKQALIFYNHKGRGEELSSDFRSLGWPTTFINGDLDSEQRILIHNNIRNLLVKIIVSTDLFSRGIDLNTVDLVINFDIPFNSTEYFHRVGRTGRYGTHGIAISFFQENEKTLLDEIISDSNPGRLHELTDINLLNNDFGVIMKSSHLKEEIKKKLITLDKMKEFTLIDEKTDLHTSINKKRRRKQFKEESLVTPWVDSSVQLYNKEFKYYVEDSEKVNNQTNSLECTSIKENLKIQNCENKGSYCLYCNLIKYLGNITN